MNETKVELQRRAQGVEWRTRWEATIRVAEHGLVVGYGCWRWTARRNLRKQFR